MQDVAADRDRQALDVALVAADRERIEQRLGRMLMRAVAGIDHRAVDLCGEQFDRAGRMMAHDQDVRVHGVERHRGVDQCLALRIEDELTDMFITSAPSRLPASSNEDWVRVEDFEEQIDLGAAAQRGALLLDLAVELDEFFGEVEETGQYPRAKALRSPTGAAG